MPTPSIPVSSSDISTLSYSVLFDISAAIPNIILTNASTVIHSNHLTWWYVITTPSGTPIHTGSLSVPDVVNVPWTTLQITPNSWPLIFGLNGACAQVEFSTGAPYVCTLYVKDSANNTFSLTISQTIVRPNGNTSNSCGNFGVAAAGITVKCYTNPAIVFCADSTNYTYNNIVSPVSGSMTNEWILTYPPDANGNQPANGTASNTPSVTFPVGYAGAGYILFLNDYAAYDMGNGATIKVQYKAFSQQTGAPGLEFAVLCNIDLCRLQCQMMAFYEVSKKNCNTVDNSVYAEKKTNINYLYAQAITGIIQPLCQIDVPAIVLEIQKIIGNVGSGCDCGCTDTGVNFNYPTGQSGNSGGCCPVSVDVIDNATGIKPSACPLSYFPVQVMDPTNSTVIGSASNINDLVSLVNATPSWEAYGIAFAEGNCKVGWFPATGATTIPNIRVNLVAVVIPPTAYKDPLIDINSGVAPSGCPVGNPYPLRIYDKTATTVIGIANSIGDVVSLLNADAGWSAFGVISVQDTCNVQFNLTNPTTIPPVVNVDSNTTSSSCTRDTQNYLVYMRDPCFPLSPVTAASFPINALVDWSIGGGPQVLGVVTGWADLVTKLNAQSSKPSVLTWSVGVVPDTLELKNSNCNIYSATPIVSCTVGSAQYILFGANHTDMIGTTPTLNGVMPFNVTNPVAMGRIPGAISDKHMWHIIYVGKYAVVAEGDTGKIYFYDVSNPLSPILASTIQLNDTGSGNCFTGLPLSTNYQSPSTPRSSYFSLYFPTDLNATYNLAAIPVFEGTTGSVWIINFFTNSVVASDHQTTLLGKCPRTLTVYSSGGRSVVYLTQDGNMEQAAGLSSTVPIGYVVAVTFTTAGSFAYSTQQILLNFAERVWAASYDGTQYIYFTGEFGSVYVLPIAGGGSPVLNANIFGGSWQFLFRLNTSCFGGKLFFAALKANLGSPPVVQGMKIADAASLASGVALVTTLPSSSGTPYFTVSPIGNCLFATVEGNGTSSGQRLSIYRTSDRTLVKQIITESTLAYVFNVISLPTNTYSPNTFITP